MNQMFSNFGISEEILKSLDELGYKIPTEVQGKSIPKVLAGQDLIVISKTGSGKTGAFGIPMLHTLDKSTSGPKALILTPTRELAVQVDQDLKQMSKYKSVRTTVVYGGHSMVQEVEKLQKGVEIVTGTPGRVYDHMNQGILKTDSIEFLVLDEADRMLDMGFFDQVQRIIKRLPTNRVTMLFSATMPPEIQRLCKSYMKTPETIEIESETKTVDTIAQFYYKVEANEKRRQLHRILTVEQPDSCMIFCNTRIAVDRVNEYLDHKGYSCKALHGANTQSNRMKSIQQFKKGDFEVLVATDVAARGIHVDDLSLVINYDVPQDKDNYIHRIGRTGRAGNGGRAITLVTKDDLFTLYEIEEHVGVLIQEEPLPTDEHVASKPQKTPKPRVVKTEHELSTEHGTNRSGKNSANSRKPQSGNKSGQQNRPPSSPSSPAARTHSNKSSKPHNYQEASRPVTSDKTQTVQVPVKANPAPVKTNSATVKTVHSPSQTQDIIVKHGETINQTKNPKNIVQKILGFFKK